MSKVTIDSTGKLFFEDAKVKFVNFSGSETGFNGQIYNREGDRNFNIVIDDPEMAQKLANDGWNIKYKVSNNDPQDPGEYRLKVNVKYNNRRGPKVYKHDSQGLVLLDEDTVGSLDKDDIDYVHAIINPWRKRDGSGFSAYLDTLHVVIKEDPFKHKFADLEG